MKNNNKKPFVIFGVTSLLLAIVFFVFPINLFDGEIVIKNGLQEITESRQLSLSYFIGIGYEKADMDIIKDFYLTPKGWIMAFIFIFGFPALFAYRLNARNKDK